MYSSLAGPFCGRVAARPTCPPYSSSAGAKSAGARAWVTGGVCMPRGQQEAAWGCEGRVGQVGLTLISSVFVAQPRRRHRRQDRRPGRSSGWQRSRQRLPQGVVDFSAGAVVLERVGRGHSNTRFFFNYMAVCDSSASVFSWRIAFGQYAWFCLIRSGSRPLIIFGDKML